MGFVFEVTVPKSNELETHSTPGLSAFLASHSTSIANTRPVFGLNWTNLVLLPAYRQSGLESIGLGNDIVWLMYELVTNTPLELVN